ncbi:hypothetical protein CKO15_02250 [Halorhodospira abdelmalekii]|nr:hypothetical protein [Halorhodospira abdelmalekii]
MIGITTSPTYIRPSGGRWAWGALSEEAYRFLWLFDAYPMLPCSMIGRSGLPVNAFLLLRGESFPQPEGP